MSHLRSISHASSFNGKPLCENNLSLSLKLEAKLKAIVKMRIITICSMIGPESSSSQTK